MSVTDLVRLFKENAVTASDCAHLCIDVQKIYDNLSTATHIADKINPVFNQLGICNYLIFQAYEVNENGLPFGSSAFNQVRPFPGDKIVRKTRSSAVGGSNIDTLLKENNSRLVAITGFAFGQCVKQTAEDIQKGQYGYHTVIFTDGVNRDPSHYSLQDEMAKKGIVFTSSQNFFEALQKIETCRSKPLLPVQPDPRI